MTAALQTVVIIALAGHVVASQTLIPAFAEGCPYIGGNCTTLELLPVPRNDTCHQNIAADIAQEVAAADAAQVCLIPEFAALSYIQLQTWQHNDSPSALVGLQFLHPCVNLHCKPDLGIAWLQGVDIVFYGMRCPVMHRQICQTQGLLDCMMRDSKNL